MPRCIHRDKLVVAAALVLGIPATATADDAVEPAAVDPGCPAAFANVGLALQNVDGGVTFHFTARNKAMVGELRHLLREAAISLEHHSKVAAMQTDVQHTRDEWVLPALDISVRDVAAGARVTVRAELRGDVADVRANARVFRRAWLTHPCVRVGGAVGGQRTVQAREPARRVSAQR